jgi:hypothetical protein
LGDQRSDGESSYNSGDGMGQMAQLWMFMMMMKVLRTYACNCPVQQEETGNQMRQATLNHRSAFIYKRTQQHLQVNKMYTYVAANVLHYSERITETCKTKSSKYAEKFPSIHHIFVKGCPAFQHFS